MTQHSRRRNAAAAVLALTLSVAAAACSAQSPSPSDGSPDPANPVTLQVLMGNHGFTEQIQAHLEEFEAATGIRAEVTVYGEEQLSDQYSVKLNAGSDDIDVMMFRPLQEGRLYWENGWLADLTGYAQAATDWDLADFQEGPISALTFDGEVSAIPVSTERAVLYYRADLLEEQGLEVPATLDALASAAGQIDAAYDDVVGFVARGGAAAAVPIFSAFLYSYGGDWTDEDGRASVDTDEAIAAYEAYGRLLRDYGPESGITDMGWDAAMAMFTQGRAAFYIDADSLATNAIDPESSTVVDQTAFAPFPAGPAGSVTFNIPNYALAVSDYSGHKDEAWAFIEYFTSPELTTEFQRNAIPGARISVWQDPDALAGFPETLASAIAASLGGIGHDRPQIARAAEAREIVGAPILTALTGGDVAAAAHKANADLQALLDEDNG